MEIPSFPFNGQYLKELEKEWLAKDFNLKVNEAGSIVNKVKKLNIFNV